MARPKNETNPAKVEDAQLSPDLMDNMKKMASLQESYSADRDLVNQLIGQAQMASALSQFSLTVSTSKLAYIKENKLYQSLTGLKTANVSSFDGTWDSFCSLIGMSRQKADLDIANLNTFGEEALESMSRMGIGYRELRQYRKLPEDQKAALIEVAKQGDKDTLLELAEDLIAKHAKEKERFIAEGKKLSERLEEVRKGLNAKLSDTEQTLAATNKRYSELKQKKDAIEDKCDELERKLNHPYENLTADEKTAVFEVNALSAVSRVKDALAKLGGVFKEMRDDETDRGVSHDSVMAKAAFDIREALENLLSEYMVPEFTVVDKRPAWLDEPAD